MNGKEIKMIAMVAGTMLTGIGTGFAMGAKMIKTKTEQLKKELIDETTKNLRDELNDEILTNVKRDRVRMINEAEKNRVELLKELNKKLDVELVKADLFKRIDKEMAEKVMEEARMVLDQTKKDAKDILKEAEEERAKLLANYCDFTNHINDRVDKLEKKIQNNCTATNIFGYNLTGVDNGQYSVIIAAINSGKYSAYEINRMIEKLKDKE